MLENLFRTSTWLKKKKNINELLEVVGLEKLCQCTSKNLKWRTTTACCHCKSAFCNAKTSFLDEPFSNLDYSRKMELRENFFNYVKEHELSVIISTHEIQEILPWIDQIVVLQEGRLIQNDSAEETLKNPYNSYRQNFLGQ